MKRPSLALCSLRAKRRRLDGLDSQTASEDSPDQDFLSRDPQTETGDPQTETGDPQTETGDPQTETAAPDQDAEERVEERRLCRGTLVLANDVVARKVAAATKTSLHLLDEHRSTCFYATGCESPSLGSRVRWTWVCRAFGAAYDARRLHSLALVGRTHREGHVYRDWPFLPARWQRFATTWRERLPSLKKLSLDGLADRDAVRLLHSDEDHGLRRLAIVKSTRDVAETLGDEPLLWGVSEPRLARFPRLRSLTFRFADQTSTRSLASELGQLNSRLALLVRVARALPTPAALRCLRLDLWHALDNDTVFPNVQAALQRFAHLRTLRGGPSWMDLVAGLGSSAHSLRSAFASDLQCQVLRTPYQLTALRALRLRHFKCPNCFVGSAFGFPLLPPGLEKLWLLSDDDFSCGPQCQGDYDFFALPPVGRMFPALRSLRISFLKGWQGSVNEALRGLHSLTNLEISIDTTDLQVQKACPYAVELEVRSPLERLALYGVTEKLFLRLVPVDDQVLHTLTTLVLPIDRGSPEGETLLPWWLSLSVGFVGADGRTQGGERLLGSDWAQRMTVEQYADPPESLHKDLFM